MNFLLGILLVSLLFFGNSNCSDAVCTLRRCSAIEQRLQRNEAAFRQFAEGFQQTLTAALVTFDTNGRNLTESFQSMQSFLNLYTSTTLNEAENATGNISSVHDFQSQLDSVNQILGPVRMQLVAQNERILQLESRIVVLERILENIQYVDRPGNQSSEDLKGALKCSMSHMLDIDHSQAEHDSELSVSFDDQLMTVSWTLPSAECFDYLTGLWLRIGSPTTNIGSETAHLIPNECLRRNGTRLDLILSTAVNTSRPCQYFLKRLDECRNYSLQVVPNYFSLKGNSSLIELTVPPRGSGSGLSDIRSQVTFTGFDLSWRVRSEACASFLTSIRVRVFQDSAHDSIIPPINQVTLDRSCFRTEPSNRFSASFPSLEANCAFQWQSMAKCHKYRLVLETQFADRWLTSSASHEFFASEFGPLQTLQNLSSCPINQFHCSKNNHSSNCIGLDRVCDGVSDCSDGSDEIDCGGGCHLLAEPSGSFPASSPLQTPGTYTISVQSGHIIWLSFGQFYSDNLVKVYEGTCTTGSLLLAHSGRSIPHSIQSVTSSIYVEIPANSSVRAYYTSVPANTFNSFADGCGGYINGQGNISSPIIADVRTSQPECWWFVENTDPERTLLLDNINSFGTSYAMAVYDGWDVNGTLISVQDGNSTARSGVFSLTNRMRVHFQSYGHPLGRFYQWAVSSIYTPQCWYNLTASSGRIFSADYPLSSFDSPIDCRWNIRDPSNSSTILVQFGYFDHINSGGIQVHDGSLTMSPVLLSTSGGVSPLQTVSSSTGELLIRLTNKQSTNRPDFLIIYSSNPGNVTNHTETFVSTTVPSMSNDSAVCRETVTINGVSGWIASPNHPNPYWNSINCSWLLFGRPGDVIRLEFHSFHTEQCCDHLRVYDGDSPSAALLLQHSGPSIPSALQSTSQFLFVSFATDGSVVTSGFNASFQSLEDVTVQTTESTTNLPLNLPTPASIPNCTHFLSGESSGSFASPNFPSNYRDNTRCSWLISTDPNTIIRLQFEQFSTEPCCDHIRVYDGSSESYALVLQHSGHSTPPTVESTSNVVLVTFTTDGSVVSPGFNATFHALNRTINSTESISSNCSHILNASSGSFTTPNHPSRYPNGTACDWLIITPPGTTILLKFHAFSTDPCCDYIRVYDGSSNSSALILEQSGLSRPAPVESTSNVFFMTFVADSNRHIGFSGFSVTFESLNRSTTVPDKNCTYILEADFGNFTSPNYPGNYSNDLSCSWLITTHADNLIQLRFSHFATEECCDLINVYDGPRNQSGSVRQLSGTSFDYGPIESISNVLLVTFNTDGSVVDAGFNASYSVVPRNASDFGPTTEPETNCTYNLNGVSGFFASPNYPETYANNLRCSWVITSEADTTILLRFNNFSTERCCDFVTVYDGPTDSSPLILRYSSDRPPDPIRSTSNVLLVKFTTDVSVASGGFEAVYETITQLPIGAITTPRASNWTVQSTIPFELFQSTFSALRSSTTTLRPNPKCNVTLETEFSSNFTSPNHPGNYLDYTRCSYLLRTPPGTRIRLEFGAFSTETCCDHVRVYDGNSTTSRQLLQHSGSTVPARVESASNVMLVTFFADHSIVSSGFTAEFQALNDSNNIFTFTELVNHTTPVTEDIERDPNNSSRVTSTLSPFFNQTYAATSRPDLVTTTNGNVSESSMGGPVFDHLNHTLSYDDHLLNATNRTERPTSNSHLAVTNSTVAFNATTEGTLLRSSSVSVNESSSSSNTDYFNRTTSRTSAVTTTTPAPVTGRSSSSSPLTFVTTIRPLTLRSTPPTPDDEDFLPVQPTASSRLKQMQIRRRTLRPRLTDFFY